MQGGPSRPYILATVDRPQHICLATSPQHPHLLQSQIGSLMVARFFAQLVRNLIDFRFPLDK